MATKEKLTAQEKRILKAQAAIDRLAAARIQVQQFDAETEEALLSFMPAPVREQYLLTKAQRAGTREVLAETAKLADEEVRKQVLDIGETVDGTLVLPDGKVLQAKYCEGRESWDGKALKGYMIAHPEVEAFLKVGEPYVQVASTRPKDQVSP